MTEGKGHILITPVIPRGEMTKHAPEPATRYEDGGYYGRCLFKDALGRICGRQCNFVRTGATPTYEDIDGHWRHNPYTFGERYG